MVNRLYKYVPCDRIDILTEGKLRFSPGTSFNDAFDLFPHIVDTDSWAVGSHISQILDALISGLRSRLYVGALLEKYALPHQGPPATPAALTLASEYILKLPESVRPTGSSKRRQKRFNDLLLYSLREGFGVLSLSEAPDNPLMWGHYGENFRGMCIGFDPYNWYFCKDKKIFGSYPGDVFQRDVALIDRDTYDIVQPVFYSTMRPQLDLFNSYYLNAFLMKSLDWAYEKEWRMIRSIHRESEKELILRTTNDERAKFYPELYAAQSAESFHRWPKLGLCDFPINAVREIIVGPLASTGFKRQIEIIVRNKFPHADVFHATLHQMDYKVVLGKKRPLRKFS